MVDRQVVDIYIVVPGIDGVEEKSGSIFALTTHASFGWHHPANPFVVVPMDRQHFIASRYPKDN